MNIVRLSRFAAFALGVAAAGCSSDSATGPSQPVSLNQALSEMSLPVLSGIASPVSSTPTASISMPSPSTCAYASASQNFVCPTVTVSGLAIAQSFTLLDAAGKPQSEFGATTTAAVRVKSSVTGTLTADGSNLTVEQNQELTLSGLLTGNHVLNGTSMGSMNGTVASGSTVQSLAITSSTSIVNLVPSKNAGGWPASGTVTEDMTTSFAPSVGPVTVHLVLTFNGTSKVGASITVGGTIEHCTIDLSNPASSCTP
jgi:hypothetical protein